MFFLLLVIKIVFSLFPYPFLSFLTHSLFQFTHRFSLSLTHSQLADLTNLAHSQLADPSRCCCHLSHQSIRPPFHFRPPFLLRPSLSPPPPTLRLPPPTDDSNGRSGSSNGRPDGSSGSRSGGRSGSVGLGFPVVGVVFGFGFLVIFN